MSRTWTPSACRRATRAPGRHPAGTRRASRPPPARRARPAAARSSRHRSASGRGALVPPRGSELERGEHRPQRAVRPPARLEAPAAGLRLVRAVRVVLALGEVARRGQREPLRIRDDERAGRVGAAEPLLPRDREEVDAGRRRRHGADGLRAVGEHRHPGLRPELGEREHGTGRPEHLRGRDEPCPRRHRRDDRVRLGRDDHDLGPRDGERPEQAEVLVGRRHDLVPRPQTEAAHRDPAPLGRRARECDLRRLGADERREGTAELLAQAHRRLEVRQAAAALDEVALDPVRESLGHRSRERAERARVEERDRLEHREERAGLGEGHDATSETTAARPGRGRRAPRHSAGAWHAATSPGVSRTAPRTRMWSIPSPGAL